MEEITTIRFKNAVVEIVPPKTSKEEQLKVLKEVKRILKQIWREAH